MMRFATRKNSISWIQCLTVSIQNELRHRLLMLFSCVFAMLASHATFAQEAGVGPAVPPEQSWKATTQLYCDFNTTRVFQSNWPGDSPVAVIEAYVAKLNELCSGGAGANHTVTYTLNPCTPTLTVSGNGTNPLALAIASGCTIQEVAVPKPSCTPAPCANPFWNNIRTAPAPSKVCASWAEGNGSRYTLAGSTYGECKCPKGSKFNSAVGKCLGEVDQTQKQQCSLQAGNPIYPGTGNKRQEETDYVGTGPAPLTFRRIYNSGTSFGRTWKTNYDQTINFYGANGTPTATVNRSEGSFSYSYVAGNWVADGDVKMALYGSNGGFTVISADGRRVETYNAQNKLTRIATRSSGTLYTLVYSTTSTPVSIAPTAGLLIQVSDAFGHSLTLTYDAQQRLGTMRDPNNGLYQYAYNAGSYLQSVTYPDGAVRQYVYNEPTLTQGANLPGVLTGIVDENNVRYANFGYNPNALAIFTEHAGGTDRYSVIYATPPSEVLEVVNNGAGVPSSYRKYTQPPSGVQITDGLGQTRNYGFTSVAGLPRATGADHTNSGLCSAVPLSRTFDANGNVSASTDFNNVTSNFTYDLTRNLQTSRTEAAGTPKARTITTQWHATFGGPIQINEPGKRITMSYDSGGNAQAVTVTDTVTTASRTWSYNYNSYDQLTSLNGPRNDVIDVTNYTYYSCTTGYQCGQVQTITNALGQVTTFNTYNAHGQPLTITDSNGVVTTLTYDARARVLSRTTTGETMSFEYWQTGLLKKTTLPEGSFISYTYDAAHRLIGVTDNAGNRVVYTLDAMGNRTREDGYDPSNTLTTTRSRVFNSLSRLSQEIAAAGTPAVTTSLAYDNNGNQTTLSAPLGRTSTNQYDELNRIKQVTDPMNGVTVYGYNALDQLISVTDPKNLATTYAYNALGDLLTQMSPDTGPTTHTFDSAGNLKTSIDARNKMATYNYDVANRVTQVAYGDQTINYNYDAGANGKGRLTSASDTAHSMSWTYDGQGRVLSKTQIASGIAKTVSYSYSSGQLTSMTTPSGQTITYSYTAGKLTGMAVNGTTLLSSVLYEPFGGTRGWTWGNGTLAVRAYDLDGKLTQLDSAGLSTYDYDNAFRITGVTDTVNAANSWNYGYDNLDRLTTATNASLTQGYSFDADGNRLTQTGTTNTTFNYPTTSNKLSSTSGSLTKTYAYDLAGNTTSDGAITYIYNNRGRMTQANTTSYVYNVLGQRIKKSNATVTTYFIYDEAGHTLSEHDISGGLIQETIWLGDIPVATLRPDGSGGVTLFYVHTDHLNTPRRISRPSDNVVVWRWDSDPFGTNAANEDPDGDTQLFTFNLRFPGQYYDAESGLNYNMERYYDPQSGRYLTSDPIGLDGGINTYAYVGGNPISDTDPMGLSKTDRWFGFNNREFQRWFHRCWKQPGNPDADKEEIAEAYAEWVSRGSPTGGKCDNTPPPPPPPVPTETCGESCKENVATVVVAGGTTYVVYRCLRMIPSLFPPLWPTIPANAAIP